MASTKTLIGLMSGTSHDGVDAVLVQVSFTRGRFHVSQQAFHTFPYTKSVRERLLCLSQGATITAGEVSQVNFLVGELFAQAVLRLCKMARVLPEQIDAIGSHGHTIYHQPRQRPGPGSTLQIGEPALIAFRTGITTIAEFRPADVAAGGEGAPLAPYAHYALFRQPTRSVAVQNIGGIANLTYLPAGGKSESLLAFDSGPGNMIIDGVTQAVTQGKLPYDRNGRLAEQGTAHPLFLQQLLQHPYFHKRPPKSTGREEFGEPFIQQFLQRAAALKLNPADQVATATMLTAESMARAYRDFVLPRGTLDEVLLSGGGRLNPSLRKAFSRALSTVRIRTLEDIGYDSNSLEAVAFAIFAYATLHGLPANVPSATGARTAVVIGKIVPGATTARRAWVDSETTRSLGLRRSLRSHEEHKKKEDKMSKHVVIIPGDDAAPEAMTPVVEILKSLSLDLTFTEFPSGEEGVKKYGSRGAFDQALREAIDQSDSTLFGSTNGTTGGINHLRWGKKTFANVRPARWRPGFRSPLKNPEGIDFVIVRENLEDLYMGVEGDLQLLSSLSVTSWLTRKPLDTTPTGKFAIKVITEAGSRRIARFAFELARKRKAKGGKGKVTCTSKYNMLRDSDGLFRRVVEATAKEYPDLRYEQYIVDDFARRLVATPSDFDVVVMPNLYGDILSDAAAGTLGGLGLAPSGCYGETYAYFESVHGSAPDIVGRNIINPTATLLSATMMLDYLGCEDAAIRVDQAVSRVYADGHPLTPDQGGTSSTIDFCAAVRKYL